MHLLGNEANPTLLLRMKPTLSEEVSLKETLLGAPTIPILLEDQNQNMTPSDKKTNLTLLDKEDNPIPLLPMIPIHSEEVNLNETLSPSALLEVVIEFLRVECNSHLTNRRNKATSNNNSQQDLAKTLGRM